MRSVQSRARSFHPAAAGLFACLVLLLGANGAEARRQRFVKGQLAHQPAADRSAPRGDQGTTVCPTGPSLAAVAQPHLTYVGGRVLAQAQIVAVLWGPPDPIVPTATCSTDFQTCLDEYYQNLIASPQFDWLDEYQTTLAAADGTPGTNQHIGRPTYYGSVVITPINTSAVVGEVDVESEIAAQVQAGHLPAPNTADETIYEVHFPLEVDPSDPAECNEACLNFCAYHDSWCSNILGTNGLLAIIPSHMPPGYSGRDCSQCGERTDWFANLGGSISHETIESITDPDVGGCGGQRAWIDNSAEDSMSVHGEIGDMCEGIPDWPAAQRNSDITEISFAGPDGGPYTVQREWSNAYSSCLGSIDDAFIVSGPSAQVLAVVGGSTDVALQTSLPFDAGAPLPVKFLAHGLPATGVAATFSPTIVDASAGTTLTFAIDATATQTGFPFGITAETGSSQAQTVLSIAAPEFDAELASQASVSLIAGGAPAMETLTSSVTTGDARAFTVVAAGIPGVTVAPGAGMLGTPLALSISAAAGTPSSSSTLAVDVTSAAVTHAIPLQLTISGDDVSMAAPAGLKVPVGGSLTFTLTTSTKAGNPQLLELSATNLPTNAVASFSPFMITSGQTSQVTVTMPDSQAQAPIEISILATGPVAQSSLNVSLTVVAASGCQSGSVSAWSLFGLLAIFAVGAQRARRSVR